jgi:hypothetical protein
MAAAAPGRGCSGSGQRSRRAQLLTVGQRSPAVLIDRHQPACRPVRDLIVDTGRVIPSKKGTLHQTQGDSA